MGRVSTNGRWVREGDRGQMGTWLLEKPGGGPWLLPDCCRLRICFPWLTLLIAPIPPLFVLSLSRGQGF